MLMATHRTRVSHKKAIEVFYQRTLTQKMSYGVVAAVESIKRIDGGLLTNIYGV